MASMTYKGAETIADKLIQLGDGAEKIAKVSLYEGAAVMLDALEESIRALPETTSAKPYDGLLPDDKEDMIAGLGVARFEVAGDAVNTKISVNGYTRRTEKKWPNGVPLPMLARSLESGSSMRKKHPFVRPAARAAHARIVAAIQAKMDDEINKITK